MSEECSALQSPPGQADRPPSKSISAAGMANDQSLAPDAIRRTAGPPYYERDCYDWDLGGPLLDGRDIQIVDCGNVTADPNDHHAHYRRAEAAAKQIFQAGTTLITLGGDHGIPIPIMRALEGVAKGITLVHIDAHLDWRDESYGQREGFRSPVRRASEMSWFNHIVQIGLRGIGSLHSDEVAEAQSKADIITAYEMHDLGIDAVLERIPSGGPYYLSIDADSMDPSLMPGVMSQTPGGLTWVQMHKLIHGLARRGRVLGMDLVEIAPSYDVGNLTLVHAVRLICNFIGACVRSGYYE
ncbi:MAG: arginase family protein [Chloroflexota bacterium]